jgi:hypothetical protein
MFQPIAVRCKRLLVDPHARFRRVTTTLALLAMTLCLAGVAARAETELMMVEQTHCEWCEAWNAEVGGVYHLTDEGKRAPLRRQDLFDPMPENVSIEGRVHFTPTFILLVDGREVGRIEGYPGEHFFWPMLAQLLNRAPRKAPETMEPKGKETGS